MKELIKFELPQDDKGGAEIPGRIEQIKATLKRLREKFGGTFHINQDLDFMTTTFSFTEELLRETTGHSFTSYEKRNQPTKDSHYQEQHHPEVINSELRKYIQNVVEKELVVDLGCGVQGTGYAMTNDLGAGGYVGVEMNFAAITEKRCSSMKGETPFLVLQHDMNDVLLDMQKHDEKAKMVIYSGIDVASYTSKSNLDAVWSRIAEILEDDGVMMLGGNVGIFGEEYGSTYELEKLFEEIKLPNLPFTIRFYSKRKTKT